MTLGRRSNIGSYRSTTSAWPNRLRRGLEGASLPLVLVTTADEPWTADHLGPLLEAIDKSDHVIGRRPTACREAAFELHRAAFPATDFRRSARRRSLSLPAPSAREALGDPAPVRVVVPRHRDPGEGDVPWAT